MLLNLAVGSLLISVTVLIHTLGLVTISRAMGVFVAWFRLHRHGAGRVLAMIATVLSLFLTHTVEVWLWGALYFALGITSTFGDALYFSTVTFSTIGYGDIVPPAAWQLLCALEGVNGFLLIGWSTAYLVSASTRYGLFGASAVLSSEGRRA